MIFCEALAVLSRWLEDDGRRVVVAKPFSVLKRPAISIFGWSVIDCTG